MNTNTIEKVLREIASLEYAGYEISEIYVSIDSSGQGLWGEICALHANEMWDAMESAGFEPQNAVDQMLSAEEFIEKFQTKKD